MTLVDSLEWMFDVRVGVESCQYSKSSDIGTIVATNLLNKKLLLYYHRARAGVLGV